jgi:predicted transposase/invertase (TIGR01784 family)
MSIADSGGKGKDYDFNFPNTYSLNFLDFDMDFGEACDEVVQYYSLSNEEHPEIRLDYASVVFVRLARFNKSLDDCEGLQDKLLYSLCHADELEEQPERLKGNPLDRLFTIIKICNFSSMELDEYKARAMFRADQKAQLEYAEEKGIEKGIEQGMEKGMEKVFALLDEGVSLVEAKKILGF